MPLTLKISCSFEMSGNSEHAAHAKDVESVTAISKETPFLLLQDPILKVMYYTVGDVL